MAPIGVFVSTSNYSVDAEAYIFHSTLKTFESMSDKVALVVYSIVLLLSLIQTFWKNQRIDRLLAYMNEAYSDGKFASNQISFRQKVMNCYRFDQRYSHIPNPNRSVLLIYAIHVQLLMIIIFRTLFIRRSELVNDCFAFHYPYEVLQCEDNRDPCQLNNTESVSKCTYYYFEMTHIITMVTSIITWHYALRYFVIKLVRFVRWAVFCDDDQPRKLCCCCQATPRILRVIMCIDYIILWLYLFVIILWGFAWNIMFFRIPVDMFGPVWAPIIIAGELLCSLTLALVPELIQNWLDATANGEVLQALEQEGLLLDKVESLAYLTKKKKQISTSTKNRTSQNNVDVTAESISRI